MSGAGTGKAFEAFAATLEEERAENEHLRERLRRAHEDEARYRAERDRSRKANAILMVDNAALRTRVANLERMERENASLQSLIRTGIAITRQTAAQERARKLEEENTRLQKDVETLTQTNVSNVGSMGELMGENTRLRTEGMQELLAFSTLWRKVRDNAQRVREWLSYLDGPCATKARSALCLIEKALTDQVPPTLASDNPALCKPSHPGSAEPGIGEDEGRQ